MVGIMKEKNKYGSVLAITGGLLVFLYIYRIDMLLYIAILFIVLGLLSSYFRTGIAWLWIELAYLLGWLNSRILLSIIFYLVLTPLAIVRRVIIKKTQENKNSAYIVRNQLYTASDLDKPW